ncbi:unnamed protein product [Symbiodinium sp. CCMP2592]|nr:unnamed protein product [Symbiodinium sp. CCMP2592]
MIGCSIPQQVWAVPTEIPRSVAELQRLGLLLPEGLRPSIAPPSDQHADDFILLPAEPGVTEALTPDRWLSVTVHAVHHVPRHYAVALTLRQGLVSLVSKVRRFVQRDRPLLSCVVPVSPQRFSGSAAFLAHPACLDELELVAGIIDLTHVGGQYFATCLPTRCTAEDLLNDVAAELDCEVSEVSIYVGAGFRLCSGADRLGLCHGDAITILRTGVPTPQPVLISELFQIGEMWDLPGDVPTAHRRPCIAVWFRDGWHVLQTALFPGRDILSIVSERFRVSADLLQIEVSLCVFGFALWGEPCSSVAVIHEHPGLLPEDDECDTWSLICDLRPIGLLPKVLSVPAQGFCLQDLERLLVLPVGRGIRYALQEVGEIPADGTPSLHTLLVTASPERDGARLQVPRTYHACGAIAAIVQGSYFFRASEEPGPPLFVHRTARHPRPPIASDSDTSENSAHSLSVSIQVLVLAVDWIGKVVAVDVRVPETEQDLFAAVEEELPQHFALRYPHLVSVWPQPSDEWATVLALPCWTDSADIVVLDLRQVDGRLFATTCAPVVMRGSLFDLADVADDGSWQVVAFGRPLVDRDAMIPIVRHGCVAFKRAGVLGPRTHTLAAMLASPFGWDDEVDVPLGPGGRRGNFVCIVLEDGMRLFRIPPFRGRHHLEDISEAFGLALHWTTARVARPAVHDACYRGHRCRGVALVSGSFPNVPVPPALFRPGDFPIALDCRAILQGWQMHLVFDFRCSHAELVQQYSTLAPPDFQAQIDGASLVHDNFVVHSGSVLTVQWVPVSPEPSIGHAPEDVAVPSDADSATFADPAPHAANTGSDEGAALTSPGGRSRSPYRTRFAGALAAACFVQQPPVLSAVVVARGPDHDLPGTGLGLPAASADMQHWLAQGRSLLQRPPPDVMRWAPDLLPLQEDDLNLTGDIVEIPFLVFALEYWPQKVIIHVAVPVSGMQALAAVNEARDGPSRALFPHLIPAYPQSRAGVGLLLAMPQWPLTDVPVLVDREHFDGRMHCAVLAPAMTRASILSAIGVEPHAAIQVYVSDSPQALGPTEVCFLSPGDMLCVAWRRHPVLVAASLDDMLQSAAGWNLQVDLPGHFDSALWVLTEAEPVSVDLTALGHRLLRDKLAEVSNVSRADLTVCTAFPRIWDHCAHGVYHRSVLAAIRSGPLPLRPARRTVFLDMRPVLHGITCVSAAPPGFNLEAFVRRFTVHCPEGFFVQVRGGDAVHTDFGVHLAVPDGGVLSVHFVQKVCNCLADLPSRRTDGTAQHGGSGSEGTEHFDLTDGQCLLPCSAEHLQTLQQKVRPCALGGIPTGVPKPWRFQDWVDSGSVGRLPGPGERLVLTADGSFCSRTGSAGWAVVLSVAASEDPGHGQFVGCLFGTVDTAIIQEPCSAFVAEVAGLLWAGVVAFQHPTFADLTFRADNQAALQGVEGKMLMPDTCLSLAARSLHFALAVLNQRTLAYQHVRGHDGDCANELADGLANFGAVGKQRLLPFTFPLHEWLADRAARARWLPHVCLSITRPSVLPTLRNGLLSWTAKQDAPRLTPHQLMGPFTRALGAAGGLAASASFDFQCRCASFNSLSLLDPASAEVQGGGLYGAAGRVGLLANSLAACQVYIAGVQETRTPAGSCMQALYARYGSGCNERRCYGVELWVARGESWPSHVFSVSHADPCRLIGHLQFAELSLNVLVGHGPHRAFSDSARREWWADTLRLCRTSLQGSDWLVLVDGNCRLGSEVSAFVGGHQPDVEDVAGTAFHELLGCLHCWLPSTFEYCMEGDGGTYMQSQTQVLHRCDFVGLPSCWNVWHVRAFVEPGITAGHVAPDHFAIVVECHIALQRRRGGKKAKRIDPVALKDPRNAERIDSILRDAPQVEWSANVNDHAAVVVEYLFGALSSNFPLANRRMRKSFLSAEAGTLHAAVAHLRYALRNRSAALRLARLRCAFLAWRGSDCFPDLFFGEWASHLQLVISALASRLADAGQALKRICRRDKRLHIDSLADQVQQAPDGEVHVALRRMLRPKKFRRSGHDPLPRLRNSEGGFCASQAEITAEWRSHFAALEGGRAVSLDELVHAVVQGQAQADPVEVLHFDEVPDLPSLAVHFRAVSPNKACGPDWLPPALCRLFSFQMAEVFYPVLLKTLAYTAEPVGMKGGTLYRIPKAGAPDPCSVTSQRAILVQSVLEKVMHKAVRGLTVREWNKTAPDLMIGGRKGQSYVFGFVCTRAFLEYTRRRSIPSAILFTDISSAYYSVIRELLTGGKLEQASVLEIAASLELTPEDLQALQAHVADEPVLCGEDSGPLLAALTQELHSGTWFLMHQDAEVVHTRRGTRPGSSLADVLYGLLFTRVLQRRGDFASEGWKPIIPWNGRRDLQPYDGRAAQQTSVEVQDLVYADDLATCIVERQVARLPAAVRGVASTSIDVLSGHGLRANVGPRKTAALLAPVGAGSKEVRRQVFSINGGRLPILRENGPGVWLTAVAQYKHLGSRISFDGSMAAEVRSKLQSARACFHEGKRDVFCSPRIDLARRVSLFRTHVLSSLFAGSGGWPCLCKRGWSLLETGFYRMLRQMLRIPRHEDQKWTYERILAAVGLPSLEGFLALERLRFVAQLVRSGPDAVFALIQQAPGFLRAIGLAEQWLLLATESTGSPGSFAGAWPAWCDLMNCRGRWKGLLRRAERWHVQRIGALAEYQQDCHAWSAHVSLRCCQALERGFDGLFEVVEARHGHEQGPSIEGVGTAHLPPLADSVSTPLLRVLQEGTWQEAEQIFDAVIAVIEPLPVIRNTVELWIIGLPSLLVSSVDTGVRPVIA